VGVEILKYILSGFILVLLQFFLIQEINLGTWIKPMPYILILFTLPFSLNRYALLFIAFFIGLFLDALSNTGGLNTAACITLAVSRVWVDSKILNTDAIILQGYKSLTPAYKNFRYFAVYTLSLTFIHHWIYFTMEYFRFTAFFTIIFVSLLSTAASFGFMLLFRILANIK
jgi:hypothetical protein